MIIEFQVPGAPVSSPRPKAFSFQGHARVCIPRKSPIHGWKFNIQKHALDAMKAAGHEMPTDGPVTLELEFIFPRPRGKIWKKKPMPREKLTHGPDLDNLAKGVMDAMNQIVYMDDRQVSVLITSKWMASGEETSRTTIKVELL